MNEAYLMKPNMYLIFGLVIVVFLSGCAQQEVETRPLVPEEIAEDNAGLRPQRTGCCQADTKRNSCPAG